MLITRSEKVFKRLVERIKLNRKLRLEKLFPEVPVNVNIDESEYNVKYTMNQKTLDNLKLVVSEEAFAAYNMVSVPDSILGDGEVIKVFSPKNTEPETVYGEFIYLQKGVEK
mgnify:CR=1 FL=1